jgi:hypothetical protein
MLNDTFGKVSPNPPGGENISNTVIIIWWVWLHLSKGGFKGGNIISTIIYSTNAKKNKK